MCNNRPSVLIIEDDAYLVCTLTEYIKSFHFNVDHAYNSKDGLRKALKNNYQLAIIDLGLPNTNGFKIVEEIRKINNKPIIIITGSQEEKDELEAFKLKVNIYHTKPIRFELLGAQIKSLLNPRKKGHIVKALDLKIDTEKRIVKVNKQIIDLTKSEMDFILMLINSKGEVFRREQIIANIKNCFNDPSKQCVDTMVSRVRKKLKQPPEQSLIKTVNGSGYSINPTYLKNIKRSFS
jgi:two-component system, OmpR family, copper resistance phosphate regulon response regulator CusR